MEIREAMTREFVSVPADTTVEQAAVLMRDNDVGMLPVISMNGEISGVLTDRDITIRAVAGDLGHDTPVQQLIHDDVQACYIDDDVNEAAARMAGEHVRRLPVLDRDNKLVGIIGLADLVRATDAETVCDALKGVTRTS